MKNVLITHNSGATNRGVEALMRGVIYAIKESIDEEVNLTAMTNQVEYDRKLFPNVEFIDLARMPKKIRFLLPFWENKLIEILFSIIGYKNQYRSIKTYLSKVDTSDYVIATGGDLFSDDYGSLYVNLEYVRVAKERGKKVILLGQSIGKFKTESSKNLAFKVLSEVDCITVREPETYKYLQEEGFNMDNVHLTADLAFLMDVKEEDESKLNDLINKNKLNIGINVSDGISKYVNSDKNKYYNDMKKISLDILDNYPNSRIFFVPHVYDSMTNDDRLISHKLSEDISSDRVINIGEGNYPEYSAKNVKSFISDLDAFLGARTHSTIASWSSIVPTLAIAYSIKSYGITKYLFGEDYSNYIVDIRGLEYDLLKKKMFNIIDNRLEIKGKLTSSIEEMKKKSFENIYWLKKTL